MIDEQIDKLRESVPGFTFTPPPCYPCCLHCKYLSQGFPQDYIDPYMYKCDKHSIIEFGEYSSQIDYRLIDVYKCDSHEYPKDYIHNE